MPIEQHADSAAHRASQAEPLRLGALATIPPAQLRKRSVGNLLRMGHCAPTVIKTALDASAIDAQWLVRLAAGLPGGIGNTGGECGGLTAPLVLIGLAHGRDEVAGGLPVAVEKSHDLLRRFVAAHGTTECRMILGHARVPLRCVGVVREAPAMCGQCLAARGGDSLPPATREAYRELYAHWQQRGFHCADAVFAELDGMVTAPAGLRDATTGFMGGTLFTGMTCSALTAGVMALGLMLAKIENSHLRVVRMIGTMAIGGDAFADDLNEFSKTMNLGNRLAQWFTTEFGSTQCRAITQCDFSSGAGVSKYVDGDCVALCKMISDTVAQKVREMLANAAP